MRKGRLIAALLVVALVIATGGTVYWFYVTFGNQVEHETNRWAVIEDVNRDKIAVEPTSDEIWSELVELHQNGTRMWIGGIVERYDNKWGFRFRPDTIRVAQFTAEGLQATLKLINSDIDYWVNLGYAYINAKVVQANSGA